MLEGLVLDLRQCAQINFVAVLFLRWCEPVGKEQSQAADGTSKPEGMQAHDSSPFEGEVGSMIGGKEERIWSTDPNAKSFAMLFEFRDATKLLNLG